MTPDVFVYVPCHAAQDVALLRTEGNEENDENEDYEYLSSSGSTTISTNSSVSVGSKRGPIPSSTDHEEPYQKAPKITSSNHLENEMDRSIEAKQFSKL